MTATTQAWLLDLDGTLYRPLGVKICMAVELLASPRAIPLLRAFRKEHERLRHQAFESHAISPFEEQVARTARHLSIPADQVRATILRFMVDEPGRWIRVFRRKQLLDEIADYRANGGKTALVSDYPARAKLEALGAESLFDVVVANGEDGGPNALKPSPAGYLAAARRLDVPPDRCLVIGDRQDADGEAARRAGMAFRLVR
jgi:HAD superfamily hydrolase (TIGR01549 family)